MMRLFVIGAKTHNGLEPPIFVPIPTPSRTTSNLVASIR